MDALWTQRDIAQHIESEVEMDGRDGGLPETKKMYRVYLVNVETLHAMCGFGSGRTREEATADALRKARLIDPGAWVEGGQVCFRGGVNY